MWVITGSTRESAVVEITATPARTRRRPAWRRSPLTLAGVVLVAILAFIAAFAPLIAPADPLEQELSDRLQPPSAEHWLGTDQLGRDVLSRMIYGARISLLIGTVVVGLAASVGIVVGLVAGYTGGWLDESLMRLTDVFFAFPALILAMAISGALGPSLTNAMIAIAVVSWPVYARLVRAQVLSLRELEYVEALTQPGRFVRAHHVAAHPAQHPVAPAGAGQLRYGCRDPGCSRTELHWFWHPASNARMGHHGQ